MGGNVIKTRAEIFSSASVVGGKESDGPLGKLFDFCDPCDRFGMKTWEKSESEMQRMALNIALAKGETKPEEIGALFAGDLLNQCVGSAYGLQGFGIPYIGLYGACSTCAESLLLASLMVSYGMCNISAAVTSSHYCSAERQYRTPLEYGAQRAPTAQWTVTGAGAFLVREFQKEACKSDGGAVVRHCLIGRVQDSGVADASNMGAAMAPAALDTLCRFFQETQTAPDAYDLILTGDLGYEGSDILRPLMRAEGYDIDSVYNDCGCLIYDREGQDVHGGGSGCGCSAVVLSADILPKIRRGELSRILFLATGAMMSPDSLKQGEKVLAVAHLLEIEHA